MGQSFSVKDISFFSVCLYIPCCWQVVVQACRSYFLLKSDSLENERCFHLNESHRYGDLLCVCVGCVFSLPQKARVGIRWGLSKLFKLYVSIKCISRPGANIKGKDW